MKLTADDIERLRSLPHHEGIQDWLRRLRGRHSQIPLRSRFN
jgi:hypothetical protein